MRQPQSLGEAFGASPPSSTGPPRPEIQLTQIKEAMRVPLQAGQTWYVVSREWFDQWAAYAGYGDANKIVTRRTAPPGPIENDTLTDPQHPSEVRRDIEHGSAYELVPETAWELLSTWYGCRGDALPRPVIEEGRGRQERVEVIRMRLAVCLKADIAKTEHPVVFCSKHSTVEQLKSLVSSKLKVADGDDTRLWLVFNQSRRPSNVLADPKSSVEDARINDGDIIALEQKTSGMWPAEREMSVSYSNQHAPYVPQGSRTDGPATRRMSVSYHIPGVCGLHNLGNTCFMNSALQCLSNTAALTQYLLEGKHVGEINRDNPLGMRGQVAEEYASLITQLWSGQTSAVAPREFKHKLGVYAPRFSGFQQQDSQELLAFLLDGLHEDLNRVRSKPYVEMPDSDEYPDEHELADMAWEFHKRRNDSVIVDLFQGQFKSTLVCPDCHKVSITFDPFMYLSLPLPARKRRFDVHVIPMRGAAALYTIEVADCSPAAQFKAALGRACGLDPLKLVLADVHKNKVERVCKSSEIIRHSDRITLYGFEVEHSEQDRDAWVVVQARCYMQQHNTRSLQSSIFQPEPLTLPIVFSTPEQGTTAAHIHAAIARALVNLGQHHGECVRVEGIPGIADDVMDEDDELDAMGAGLDLQELYELHVMDATGGADSAMDIDSTDDVLDLSGQEQLIVRVDFRPDAARSIFKNRSMPDFKHYVVTNVGNESVSLYDCLDLFTQEEELGADDLWYCPQCKNHKQATKKFDLWRLPDVLVVHLKRFSDSRWHRRKLDTLVEFPIQELDVTRYVQRNGGGSHVYDLHAVSCHFDTALARNHDNGTWYVYDDSSVQPTTTNRIQTPAAYVLFYTRRPV